jgi:hypothetical protein
VVCIVAFARASMSRRVVAALVFLTISSTPLALFVFRNMQLSGQAHPMRLLFHAMPLRYLDEGVKNALSWFLPPMQSAVAFKAGFVLTFIILFSILRWSSWEHSGLHARSFHRLPVGIMVICIVLYLSYFVASATLLDLAIRPEARHLVLPHVLSIIAVTVYLSSTVQAVGKATVLHTSLVALFALSLIGNLYSSVTWAGQARREGLGYANMAWSNSQTICWLRQLPVKQPVYSNYPDVVYWHTGRSCLLLPMRFDVHRGRLRAEYTGEMRAMLGNVEAENGVVVYFYRRRPDFAPVSELQAEARLQSLTLFDDAAVFSPSCASGSADGLDGRSHGVEKNE